MQIIRRKKGISCRLTFLLIVKAGQKHVPEKMDAEQLNYKKTQE